MKLKYFIFAVFATVFSFTGFSQTENVETNANYIGTVSHMEYVPSIASRKSELLPADNKIKQKLIVLGYIIFI